MTFEHKRARGGGPAPRLAEAVVRPLDGTPPKLVATCPRLVASPAVSDGRWLTGNLARAPPAPHTPHHRVPAAASANHTPRGGSACQTRRRASRLCLAFRLLSSTPDAARHLQGELVGRPLEQARRGCV
jgi:hypothetical protein